MDTSPFFAEAPLRDLLGRRVIAADGAPLGVVVGRITTPTGSTHLLVRRRCLFRRASTMRVPTAALSARDGVLLHLAPPRRDNTVVALPSGHRDEPSSRGAA